MPHFSKPLHEISADDIRALVRDRVAESSELEFKEVPPLTESFRNKIAEVIVAFAAADGGTLVLGVAESEDPKEANRAGDIKAVANCEVVADQLRQSVLDRIEPPLRALQVRAVPTEADGSGVIVIVTPRTRRALHRVRTTQTCLVRSGVENRKLDMREINDMVLTFANEPNRIEQKFARLKQRAEKKTSPKLHVQEFVVGVRTGAVPFDVLEIDPIFGRAELAPVEHVTTFQIDPARKQRGDVWYQPRRRVPTVRGEIRHREEGRNLIYEEVFSDGSAGFVFLRTLDTKWLMERESPARIAVGWILATLATTLVTVDRLRRLAGVADARYGLDVELLLNSPTRIAFGDSDVMQGWDDFLIQEDATELPRYEISSTHDFPALYDYIMQDVLHSATVPFAVKWGVEVEERR